MWRLFSLPAPALARLPTDPYRIRDLGHKRNLLISSIILVLGIGGAELVFTDVHRVSSMALGAVVGIFLHAVLPGKETAGDTERILGDA